MKQNRNTPQRELVRELLTNNYTHPTADEVYELARSHNPSISRGTVYRNLNLLAENGEIARLTMPIGADHYDCNTANHYHFVCQNCSKILDANVSYDHMLDTAVAAMLGCKTLWHSLTLFGLCPECNK